MSKETLNQNIALILIDFQKAIDDPSWGIRSNLGFETCLVEDACFTFGKKDWNGKYQSAEDIHAMSLANLHQEYCTVITTEDALNL